MIDLSERFSLSRDRYQWILTEKREGKDKDGNPKMHGIETYHSNLNQVAAHMVGIDAIGCEAASELSERFNTAADRLAEMLIAGVER